MLAITCLLVNRQRCHDKPAPDWSSNLTASMGTAFQSRMCRSANFLTHIYCLRLFRQHVEQTNQQQDMVLFPDLIEVPELISGSSQLIDPNK